MLSASVYLVLKLFSISNVDIMVNNDCTKVLRSHSLLHSHKKRKESLKTRAVLLIFFFELEIYGMVLLGIHQNNENDSFYCFIP